jgi:hypothetical protein
MNIAPDSFITFKKQLYTDEKLISRHTIFRDHDDQLMYYYPNGRKQRKSTSWTD